MVKSSKYMYTTEKSTTELQVNFFWKISDVIMVCSSSYYYLFHVVNLTTS